MWKTKFFYKLTLPLIFSLLIAVFIFVLSFRFILRETLFEKSENNFLDYTRIYTSIVDSHLSTLRSTALQIKSRTQIRLEMQKLHNGEVTASQAEDYIYPKLADAVLATKAVDGVVWTDANGVPIVTVGSTDQNADFKQMLNNLSGESVFFSAPVLIDESMHLAVITEINSASQSIIGYNIVYFSIEQMHHLLSEQVDSKVYVQLIGHDNEYYEITHLGDTNKHDGDYIDHLEYIDSISIDTIPAQGMTIDGDQNFMAIAPVAQTDWYLLSTIPKIELFRPLNRLLSIVFFVILTMALIMMSAIWRIVVTSVIEVEKYQVSLEKSNASLTKALKEQKRIQDQLIRRETLAALGELVGGLMHELNTPIGTALTSLSFMDSEARSLLDKEQLDASQYTEAYTITQTNLNRAITNIETFRVLNMDQATLEMRRIHLLSYVNEILLSLKPKLKVTQHEVKINCNEDLHVITTPGILSQVITNLIVNSLIHGFENIEKGTITLTFEQKDTQLHFIYQDDGVGIPEKNLKSVFKPYFTTKRHQGGTGLGLHIIYAMIVNELNGQIQVTSQEGKGVRFDIYFPVS